MQGFMVSKHFRNRLEYWGLLFIAVPWYYLPRTASLALGSVLGWFAGHFVPIRRGVAESNIQRAFPRKSHKEVRKITLQMYRHFGRVVAEFVRQRRYTAADLNKFITTENQHLLDSLSRRGEGAVMLLGHFGNWELLGHWIGAMGYHTVALQRPQENPLVDTYIQDQRIYGTLRLLSIHESTSDFLSVLHDGNILFMLADQDARQHGIFVDFFGIPSSTPRGAAVFAQKLQIPIILAFPIRQPDNTYKIIFEELEYGGRGSTTAIRNILQQYMNRLEYYVSLYPEQYFWFHRRWKTQPIKQNAADAVRPSLAGAAG